MSRKRKYQKTQKKTKYRNSKQQKIVGRLSDKLSGMQDSPQAYCNLLCEEQQRVGGLTHLEEINTKNIIIVIKEMQSTHHLRPLKTYTLPKNLMNESENRISKMIPKVFDVTKVCI